MPDQGGRTPQKGDARTLIGGCGRGVVGVGTVWGMWASHKPASQLWQGINVNVQQPLSLDVSTMAMPHLRQCCHTFMCDNRQVEAGGGTRPSQQGSQMSTKPHHLGPIRGMQQPIRHATLIACTLFLYVQTARCFHGEPNLGLCVRACVGQHTSGSRRRHSGGQARGDPQLWHHDRRL